MRLLIIHPTHCVFAVLLFLLAQPATAQVADITLKDGNICRGNKIDLGTLIVEHPASVPYSRWKEGSTYLNTSGFSWEVSPTATTVYTLEYRLSPNGDTLRKEARVTVWLEPDVKAPADTSVCRGQSVTLRAIANNATEIIWRYGSNTYADGVTFTITESKAYSLAVTARNEYCPSSSSATWSVRGNAPIISANVETKPLQTYCKDATINLDSLLLFTVKNDEGISFAATCTNLTTTWTSNGTPVSAANYKVPAFALLRATVNAAVSYTSVCGGAQTYTISNHTLSFPITGQTTQAYVSCKYQPCPGEPVNIQISLTSPCNDTIKDVHITHLGYSANCNLISSAANPRIRDYRCPPISYGQKYTVHVETIALDTTMQVAPDTIKPPEVNWPSELCRGDSADFCITTTCDNILSIDWTVSPASVTQPRYKNHDATDGRTWCFNVKATEEATYTAEIRYRRKETSHDTSITVSRFLKIKPSWFSMNVSPSEICKGDSAYIAIQSDCDSIVGIASWNISPPPRYHSRSKQLIVYRATVEESKTITAEVTYRDPLTANVIMTTSVSAPLNVCNTPPELSPASYNLCRGTAGTATIVANACDTIKNVVWKDKSGAPLLSQPSPNPGTTTTEWQYTLSPNDSITYVAEIEYMRSSETSVKTVTTDFFVSVRERPHILKQDSVPVCETASTINLNAYIDSSLVDVGTVSWGINPPVIPMPPQYASERHYEVRADYAYMCSEMTTTAGEPEVLTIFFQKDKRPAFKQPAPNTKYCQNHIPLEAVEQFTTYKWTLPGGVEINEPAYTYTAADAGEFKFKLTAQNTCGTYSNDSTITAAPIPYVKVAAASSACVGTQVKLALLAHDGQSNVSWNPNPTGEKEPVITVANSGTYIVSVDNIPCPSAYDTAVITALDLAHVEAMDSRDICENSELTLSVKSWHGDTLYWREVIAGNIFIPVLQTTFPVTSSATYVAIASNTCNNDTSAAVVITMLPLPFVITRPDTVACLGDTLTLTALDSNATLSWFADGRRIEPPKVVATAAPATYTVVASNSCGQSTPDTITVISRPPIMVKPAELPAFKHNTYYDLRFSAENALYPVSYGIEGRLPAGLVFKSDGSLVGYPLLSGNSYYDYPLTVTATDAGNCKASYNYVLSPAWRAPNAFIPGSSGNNSIFLAEYQLEIYDRRGDLVHKGLGWTGLDGNGKRAPSGTYYYKVIISQPDKTTRYFSGFITVLPQK